MTKITTIEGIGPAFAEKLGTAGVRSTEALLKQGAAKRGRQQLASAAGIDEKKLLEWVNHADLFRIKGVGGEYAELLEASGVDTVPELARRNVTNLHQKMVGVNKSKSLVRQLPSDSKVSDWVAQAKSLPRVVQY